jgi:hypothetical protein
MWGDAISDGARAWHHRNFTDIFDTVLFGKWEFWGDARSTPLSPAWFGILNGLWLAAIWILVGAVVGSEDPAVPAATAFVVGALLMARQTRSRMPRWPAGLSFTARRQAAWAVRRGEVVEDPVAAAGVLAAAVSVQRDHASLPRAQAVLGILVVMTLAGVATAIALGNVPWIAVSSVSLVIVALTFMRLPGALRRQDDNAAAALAGARRLLGEPAA